MLLARDPEAAEELKCELAQHSTEPGNVVSYRISDEGLRIRTNDTSAACGVAAYESIADR